MKIADGAESPKTAASTISATRNRERTEAKILAAVGAVLARDGFGGVGVNAVARQAGVDKVLIYRYFGGLPDLLSAWGRSGSFWPNADELLGDDPAALLALPLAERFALFMDHFINGLRARPLTVEVLAAEVVERNELTAILEAQREEWGQRASRMIGGDEYAARPELRGLILLLVCGVQYLMIRSRNLEIFGGVNVASDEGWEEIKRSVRLAAKALLPDRPAANPAGRDA